MVSLSLAFHLFAPIVYSYSVAATVIQRSQGSLLSSYDYVVAGGGISGLTVATRLTENPYITVLVIEIGAQVDGEKEFEDLLTQPNPTPPSFSVPTPGYAKPGYKWDDIVSEPNVLINNRVTRLDVAKVLGGGSEVNGKIWGRDWAAYLDDEGWGWKSMRKYFKRVETFHPPTKEYRKKGNVTWDPNFTALGGHGPIDVTFPDFFYESAKYLVEGEKGMGVPQRGVQGDDGLPGGFWVPSSIHPKEYTRSSSKVDYYDPVKGARQNLHVMPDTGVTKILFKGKTAFGVEYAAGPKEKRMIVRAKKEVIVAAGAVKTTPLLQISGVGDKKLLKRLGVPIVHELPTIGQNFQDHAFMILDYNLTLPNEEAWWIANNHTFIEQQYYAFRENRTGHFTANINNRMMLLPLPTLAPDTYQSILSPFAHAPLESYLPPNAPPEFLRQYRRQHEIMLASLATNETATDENAGGTMAGIVRPLSRGIIEARTTNIWDSPYIDYRTLSHPLDLELVLAAFKFTRRYLARPELKPLGPVENTPGLGVTGEEELKSYIKTRLLPNTGHACCTVAMGSALDSKLRVLGVDRLRVIDSASWPMIPGGHATQQQAYAVAERAADLIKEMW